MPRLYRYRCTRDECDGVRWNAMPETKPESTKCWYCESEGVDENSLWLNENEANN